ncbi:TetR/AcrR family transcriptional regulator [Actinoplanes sp. CA-030573]|uniref:TetR/AcrR family transcriptional regulator n=1 Tax=Actinoplanes sp. CA-030573 TaxID=3239898 RepID=UPI003D8E7270
MPTGVALRDVREQLFAAAERVLLRAGPHALTSRAVTAEAGVAKGVLHKHFADFDDFLASLVMDRIARISAAEAGLIAAAGTRTVAANLRVVLEELFGSVAVAIISLITFRDDLRARLRAARGAPGVPLLGEAAAMIAAYLRAEQELGRVAADADVVTVAGMLIGTGHLMFADRDGTAPSSSEVDRMLTAALAGVLG